MNSKENKPKEIHTAAAAKSLQSCPTLCHPIDGSSPGSPIPGILQARTLEWVAISFSNAWECKVKVKSLSCFRLPATPWTAAYQAPPSMDFPGKSTGVGCHCLLRIPFSVGCIFQLVAHSLLRPFFGGTLHFFGLLSAFRWLSLDFLPFPLWLRHIWG